MNVETTNTDEMRLIDGYNRRLLWKKSKFY